MAAKTSPAPDAMPLVAIPTMIFIFFGMRALSPLFFASIKSSIFRILRTFSPLLSVISQNPGNLILSQVSVDIIVNSDYRRQTAATETSDLFKGKCSIFRGFSASNIQVSLQLAQEIESSLDM